MKQIGRASRQCPGFRFEVNLFRQRVSLSLWIFPRATRGTTPSKKNKNKYYKSSAAIDAAAPAMLYAAAADAARALQSQEPLAWGEQPAAPIKKTLNPKRDNSGWMGWEYKAKRARALGPLGPARDHIKEHPKP